MLSCCCSGNFWRRVEAVGVCLVCIRGAALARGPIVGASTVLRHWLLLR